ncbi:MAG TPA: pantoate--beta-alanine ligase [Acidimicrobiales bacterium]|nr:pantoate--beta-alanine ligase [Acidimicrobiales bacterium]
MEVLTTIAEARLRLDAARASGRSVGLVPTMGYLHEGHRSLMDRSVASCDVTLVTIFVNPLQFGPNEDLATYPRDLERDVAMCADAGVDVVLHPTVEEMYPFGTPTLTSISVARVSEPMEGASRPAHFAGVATVVAKLFNIAGPCHAFFGEKDWQQLAVIRRMAADLSFPVSVVGCPTVREPDGLAMSSRNAYLSVEERAAAPVVHWALVAGAAAIAAGERSADRVRELMADLIRAEPLAELDYAEVVDATTLQAVDPLAGELRLLAATRFGRARLIDNEGATVKGMAST